MREDDFILKNSKNWETLEKFNKKFKKVSVSSSKEDIREFASLYRTASHNLAYSRTHFGQSKTTLYLNQLVSETHNHFYIKEKSGLKTVWEYFSKGFPQAVAKHRVYILAALAIFMIAGLFCAVMTLLNPDFAFYFLTPGGVDLDPKELDNYATLSAFIMTNNIRVCAMSMAYGITAGFGTVYILGTNGGMLGALWAHILNSGVSFFMPEFWALILPHGFIELTAIFISGGCGLLIGKNILIPKELSRKHSLVKGFKETVYMLPGITVMLVIAGIIEGFFTPINLPIPVKIGFAFFTLIGLLVYFRAMFKKKKVATENDKISG